MALTMPMKTWEKGGSGNASTTSSVKSTFNFSKDSPFYEASTLIDEKNTARETEESKRKKYEEDKTKAKYYTDNIGSFVKTYNDISDYSNGFFDSWKSQHDSKHTQSLYSSLQDNFTKLRDSVTDNSYLKDVLSEDEYIRLEREVNAIGKSIEEAMAGIKSASDVYAQYGSADDYDRHVRLSGMSSDELQKQIDDLDKKSDYMSKLDSSYETSYSSSGDLMLPVPTKVKTKEYDDFLKKTESDRVELTSYLNNAKYNENVKKYGVDPAGMTYEEITEYIGNTYFAQTKPDQYDFVKKYYDSKGDSYWIDKRAEEFVKGLDVNDLYLYKKAVETNYDASTDPEAKQDYTRFNELEKIKGKIAEKTGVAPEQVSENIALANRYFNAENREKSQEAISEAVGNRPILSNVASVGLSAVGSPLAFLDQVAQTVAGKITGNDTPMDLNTAGQTLVNISNDIREETRKDIEEKTSAKLPNGKNLGVFAYDALMNIADVATGMVVGGVASVGKGLSAKEMSKYIAKVSGFISSSRAAASEVQESIKNGDSNGAAVAKGAIVGAIEALTERFQIDNLVAGIVKGDTAIKTVLKGALSEGTEEVVSNILAEDIMELAFGNGVRVSRSYNDYLAQGYKKERALEKAILDMVGEDAETFVSAAIAGAAFGGIGAVSTRANDKNNTKMAQDAVANEIGGRGDISFLRGINSIMAAAEESPDDVSVAQAAQMVNDRITYLEDVKKNLSENGSLKRVIGEKGVNAEIEKVNTVENSLKETLGLIRDGSYDATIQDYLITQKELAYNSDAQATALGDSKLRAAAQKYVDSVGSVKKAIESLVKTRSDIDTETAALRQEKKTIQESIRNGSADANAKKRLGEINTAIRKNTRDADRAEKLTSALTGNQEKFLNNALGADQKRISKALSDASGRNVSVQYDSTMGENEMAAMRTSKSGVSTLALNPERILRAQAELEAMGESGVNVARGKVVHEAGHLAARTDGTFVPKVYEVYASLRDSKVIPTYAVNEADIKAGYGESVAAFLKTKSALEEKNDLVANKGMSEEEATRLLEERYMQEEYVMHFLEYMENNGANLYSTIVPEKRNAFVEAMRKIAQFFRDIAAKIRGKDPASAKKMESLADKLYNAVRDFAGGSRAAQESVKTKTAENTTATASVESEGSTGTHEEDERKSVNRSFASEIDEWKEDGMPKGERFILGTTGDVLQGLGAIENDIYMNGDKIRSILEAHPEMSLNTIKRIPELLDDPVLVLASKGNSNKNTRVIVFGNVTAENGVPVLSVLDLRPVEGTLVVDDMQKVNSSYTKDNSIGFVESSDVLYADKKRTTHLLRTMGLHSRPIELQKSGFLGSITYNGQKVNISGIPFYEIFSVYETDERKSLATSISFKDSDGRQLIKDQVEFFKDSKAVDENGNLKVLYHGTYGGEFYTFDKSKGNVEGDFGSGFYFTDSEYDVESNYVDGGPDFENKVARLAEQIEAEEEIDYHKAEARARKELYNGGNKFEVYLNIENPAIVGETYLLDPDKYYEEYDREDYDSDEDYEGEVEQRISDDIDQIIVDVENNVDVYSIDGLAEVLWNAVNEGGIDIEQLKENINDLYLEDSNGNLVGNEVTRQVIESLGYDGIIDPTVSNKWNMDMEEGTTHYIVFKPNQIKDISNQNPTEDPDIRYSIASDSDYMSAVKRGDMAEVQRMVDEAAKASGYNYHLYHGTDADFTKFDLRKFGGRNGKGEGYGIYLAANREISAPYGKNVINSYTKFKRLAEGRKRTLTKAEVKKIIRKSCEIEARRMVDDGEYDSIAEAIKDTWVSNYVYTYEYPNMSRVYTDVADIVLGGNDNDGEIINEIMSASGGHYNYDGALDFYENVLTPTTGIDGFHYIWGNADGSGVQNDIYLAFKSEQIKSADPITYDDNGNIIPLSERFNPENDDIRYSKETTDKRIARLKEDKEFLKQQMEKSRSVALSPADVDKIVKEMRDQFGFDNSERDNIKKMLKLIDDVVNGKIKPDRMDEVWDSLARGARSILEGVYEVDASLMKENEAFIKHIRSTPYSVPVDNENDFAGGYAEYRNENRKYVNLSRNGTPIDVVYEELRGQYPGVLDSTIDNPVDQIEEIVRVMKSFEPEDVPSYADTIDQASQEFVNVLGAKYMNTAQKTYAQQMRDKADEIRKDKFDRRVAAEVNRVQSAADRTEKAYKREIERIGKANDKRLQQTVTAYEARLNRIENAAARDAMEYERIINRYRDIESAREFAGDRKEYARRIRQDARAIRSAAVSPNRKKFVPEKYRENVERIAVWLDRVSVLGRNIHKDNASEAAFAFVRSDFQALTELFGDDFYSIASGLLGQMEFYASDLTQMESKDLKEAIFFRDAYKLGRLMRTSIANQNKVYLAGKNENATDVGSRIKDTLEKRKGKQKEFESLADKKRSGKGMKVLNEVYNKNLSFTDGYSFFHRMGKVGDSIFETLQDAQSRQLLYVKSYTDTISEKLKGVDLSKYAGAKQKTVSVTLESGKEFSMTAAQAMSAVTLFERENGRSHMEKGGIQIYDPKTRQLSRATALTEADIAALRNALDEEDKRVMKVFADFMRDECTAWGNEATMEKYGFHRFTTANYFPIKVNRDATGADMKTYTPDQFNVENVGFAKSAKEDASAPVVIGSMIDVANAHVSGMATYAAYLNVEDGINRVLKVDGVKDAMRRALGSDAEKYITEMMNDLKGAGKDTKLSDNAVEVLNKMAGRYKAAAVSYNASTVAKQPLSYLRAAAVIGEKYLGKGVIGDKKQAFEQMMQYSGIAVRKEIGYSDVGVGKTLGDRIGYTEKGTFAYAEGKFNEFGMKGAAAADRLTWEALWIACRAEQAEKNASAALNDDALMKATAKRFAEVVARTQVVDSALTSAPVSRSGNGLVRLSYAFTSEPIKNYNMLVTAIDDLVNADDKAAKSRAAKHIARVSVYTVIGWAIEAAITSAFQALRDDDDDFFGKFGETYLPNLLENTAGLLVMFDPVAETLKTKFQGYDVTSMADQPLADLVDNLIDLWDVVIKNKDGKRETEAKIIRDTFESISTLAGMPMKNLFRILTNARKALFHSLDLYKAEYNFQKFWYNPNNATAREKNEFNSLLADAYISGDKEAYEYIYEDMRKSGLKPQSLVSSIAKDAYAGDIADSEKSTLVKYTPGSDAWYIGMKTIFDRDENAPKATEDEITRVYKATSETSVLPKFKDGKYTVDGVSKEFEGASLDKYLEDYGRLYYEVANAMRDLAAYRRGSAEEQAWWLTKAERFASAVAVYTQDKDYSVTSVGKWVTDYIGKKPYEVAKYIVGNLEKK